MDKRWWLDGGQEHPKTSCAMKKLLLLCIVFLPIFAAEYLVFTGGCATKTAYQSIAATESIVLNANSAYLEAVVVGKIPTNSVPQVEQAFNETQLVLHAAVVAAQGGSTAPVPPDAAGTAKGFTNLVYSILRK